MVHVNGRFPLASHSVGDPRPTPKPFFKFPTRPAGHSHTLPILCQKHVFAFEPELPAHYPGISIVGISLMAYKVQLSRRNTSRPSTFCLQLVCLAVFLRVKRHHESSSALAVLFPFFSLCPFRPLSRCYQLFLQAHAIFFRLAFRRRLGSSQQVRFWKSNCSESSRSGLPTAAFSVQQCFMHPFDQPMAQLVFPL
jgi:hypothetical protein